MCNWLALANWDAASLSFMGCNLNAVEESEDKDNLPSVFSVSAAHPNPFNGEVSADLDVPEVGDLSVDVYNILGQVVYSEQERQLPSGSYRISIGFDEIGSSGVASGVYFLHVVFNSESVVRKLNYVK